MKYQAVVSIAGGPAEELGLPQTSRMAAEELAKAEVRRWSCRVDWWIREVTGSHEEESE